MFHPKWYNCLCATAASRPPWPGPVSPAWLGIPLLFGLDLPRKRLFLKTA
jgi:hypothetical protein